jgi:hypothetical protein
MPILHQNERSVPGLNSLTRWTHRQVIHTVRVGLQFIDGELDITKVWRPAGEIRIHYESDLNDCWRQSPCEVPRDLKHSEPGTPSASWTEANCDVLITAVLDAELGGVRGTTR